MTSFNNWLLRPHRIKRLRAKAAHDDSARALLRVELMSWTKDLLEAERADLALGAVQEAVALSRPSAETREAKVALTECLSMLTLVLCEQGRFEEAERVGAESLALAQSLQFEGNDKRVNSLLRTANFLLAACVARDEIDTHAATEASPSNKST